MDVNIKDVAKRAGVSNATVSRVLSGKPHVRKELIERVLNAAHELGYRPSRVARSLRSQKSHIIGLIISDIMNPFFTALIRAVEDVASRKGYAIFLCNADESLEKETEYIQVMHDEKVAGLLITPTDEYGCMCKEMLENGTPIVAFDRRILHVAVDTVLVDNIRASYQAVSHLIRQGHRRIAAVTAGEGKTTGRERLQGYRRALQDNGIPIDPLLIFTGVPKKETGRDIARSIRRMQKAPTAIFCGNNQLAMGVLGYLQETDARIPEDYSLVSFDDLDWFTLTRPAITAVQQPVYELGKTAAELLFDRIEGKSFPTREVMLETRLIVRDSTAPIEVQ